MNKLVVYTTVLGSSRNLHTPLVLDPAIDYICLTDDHALTAEGWQTRLLPAAEIPDDLNEERREHLSLKIKINPHLYFPDYESSLYLHNTYVITGDLNQLIQDFARTSPIMCLKHGERDCLYEEFQACKEAGFDSDNSLTTQVIGYLSEGMPQHAGLITSTLLYRRHLEPKVISLMNSWWQEVDTKSNFDQLSFNYVCWKHRFAYDTYFGNNWNNDYFFAVPDHVATAQFDPRFYAIERQKSKLHPQQTLEQLTSDRSLSNRALMPAKYYIDYGEGFLEENSAFVLPEPDGAWSTFRFIAPEGAQKIRFDPLEGMKCVVTAIRPTANGQPLSIRSINGRHALGGVYFDNTDPQYLIEFLSPGDDICIKVKLIVSPKFY